MWPEQRNSCCRNQEFEPAERAESEESRPCPALTFHLASVIANVAVYRLFMNVQFQDGSQLDSA